MAKNISIMDGGFLQGKKTYITAFVGIISSVAAYLTGTMGMAETIQIIIPLLALIFLRKGIADK